MKISRSALWAFYTFAVAALLAGCSLGASQSPSPGSGLGMDSPALPVPGTRRGLPQPAHDFLGVKWNGVIHRDHRKSWISPDATKATRLLFVSDVGTGDVNIFALPAMTFMGVITGFQYPQGECSDRNGHIYIADTDAAKVEEYSRDGHLHHTYHDTMGPPVGCAVNPTNGNLAVVNYPSTGGPGQVLIYSSPSSPPTELTNPAQDYYNAAGYDPSGNLWVDGFDATYTFILSSCGASSCSTINLSGGTIYFAGSVQWDKVRNTWVVFDQYCNDAEGSCSYPVSGSGKLGTPTIYSDFDGGVACDLVQGVIAANGMKYVAGADYDYCGSARSTVDRWAYTAGGEPTNHTIESIDIPIGAAISTK